MIWAIIAGMSGFAMTGLGALFVLAGAMPKFGGGSDEGMVPVGAVLMLAGISLIFFAGTLL